MVTFIVEYRICHEQYENVPKLNVCINYHNLSYFFFAEKGKFICLTVFLI